MNGISLGRKKKKQFEYRLRWDDVIYEPGELKVIAYKNGKIWAEDMVKTTGEASQLSATADRRRIIADGKDLSLLQLKLVDKSGLVVPVAANKVSFEIEGPGEIVATDNGDPANMVSFASKEREAYSGLVLAIVRSQKSRTGAITVKAKSEGFKEVTVTITTINPN